MRNYPPPPPIQGPGPYICPDCSDNGKGHECMEEGLTPGCEISWGCGCFCRSPFSIVPNNLGSLIRFWSPLCLKEVAVRFLGEEWHVGELKAGREQMETWRGGCVKICVFLTLRTSPSMRGRGFCGLGGGLKEGGLGGYVSLWIAFWLSFSCEPGGYSMPIWTGTHWLRFSSWRPDLKRAPGIRKPNQASGPAFQGEKTAHGS